MSGLTLAVFVLSLIASGFCDCDNVPCNRPSGWYNFTRFPLADVIADVRYYFPSSPHPPPNDFISDSRALPTITFTKEAKLKVTFVFEGAGRRNQLGFFLFNTTTRPDGTVVYNKYYEELLIPDVSFDNKCLWEGWTIDSRRTMVPGEKLGFYLRSDGLCKGNDADVYYSIPSFNKGDVGVRHMGTYLDRYRELLIFGFEDLPGLGDRDYEDTMFFFDTLGLDIDFGNIARGCTNPPCVNGGTCNYNNGICNCPKPEVWGAFSCHLCMCSLSNINPCINKNCAGTQCRGARWDEDISKCVSKMNSSCVSTPKTCITETSDDTSDAPTTEDETTETSSPFTSATSSTTVRSSSSVRATSSSSVASPSLSRSSSSSSSTIDKLASSSSSSSASSAGTNVSPSGSNGSQTSAGPVNSTGAATTSGVDVISESDASVLCCGVILCTVMAFFM